MKNRSNAKLIAVPPPKGHDDLVSWLQAQFKATGEAYQKLKSRCEELSDLNKTIAELLEETKSLNRESEEGQEELANITTACEELFESIKDIQSKNTTSVEWVDIDDHERALRKDPEYDRAFKEIDDRKARFLAKYSELKVKRGLKTQDDVAKVTGIDRRQISRIESGKVMPHFKTVLKIAEGLRVDVTQLWN